MTKIVSCNGKKTVVSTSRSQGIHENPKEKTPINRKWEILGKNESKMWRSLSYLKQVLLNKSNLALVNIPLLPSKPTNEQLAVVFLYISKIYMDMSTEQVKITTLDYKVEIFNIILVYLSTYT